MIWTDEMITDLRARWEKGESASIIAAAIEGATRNGVLGKVHRLRLKYRNTLSEKTYYRPSPTYKRPSRTKAAIAARKAAKINVERPKRIEIKVKKLNFATRPEEPTKNQLRAMLTQAVINTAAMS